MKYLKPYNELHKFLKPKSKEEIEILSKDFTWNQKFENGCKYGFISWVKDAIEHGVHPGNMNNNGITTAMNYNHREIVELLYNDQRVQDTLLGSEKRKYYNYLYDENESIKDFLKPKSEYEIKKSIDNLSDVEKILKLLHFNDDWSDNKIKNIIGDYLEINQLEYNNYISLFIWNAFSNEEINKIKSDIKDGYSVEFEQKYIMSIRKRDKIEWSIKKTKNLYAVKKIYSYFDGGGWLTSDTDSKYFIVYDIDKLIKLINNYSD